MAKVAWMNLEIEMDKLQRIEEMERQLAALKAEVEQESNQKRWEPEGGEFWVSAFGNVEQSERSYQYCASFGVERKTRKQAEKAAKAMRTHNRLLAYVAEFAPDWKPDWGNEKLSKWAVAFNHETDRYQVVFYSFLEEVGIVTMPESVALELCRKLNSGEVVL